jgi:hypothetical protein
LYLFLLLFPLLYFCSLEHSMYHISKSCLVAWVVYLRLISEAWCLVFYPSFFNDERGAGPLHQPPSGGPGDFWLRFSSSSPW